MKLNIFTESIITNVRNFERRQDRMLYKMYNTRSSSFNFNVPNVNNFVSKQTFYYHGIVDWNSLPEEI